MIPARIWTDGCCVFEEAHGGAPRGWGGWAAIIRRGGFDLKLRGRQGDTTAMTMELHAIVEALRTLPPAVEATVFSDIALAIFVIEEKWKRWRFGDGEHDPRLGRSPWAPLVGQIERVQVEFEFVAGRAKQKDEHRWCHSTAKEEAIAARANLAPPMTIRQRDEERRNRLGARRQLRGPPPPSPGWLELAALARGMREEKATADPDSHW